MLKSIEDISSTKKRLLIEIPAEDIEREIQSAYAKAQREARVPGFRPGKVPMNIIVKRYGTAIEAEVLERLVPESYKQSIKESGLAPVSPPELEERYEYKRNSPLLMKIKVDVRPKVEPLNYKGIVVKDVPVVVTEEDIQRILHAFAKERGNYEVSDEAIGEGDLVTFDCSLGNEEQKDVPLRAGSSMPYPEDFSRAFIGKKTNDVFQIEADFTGRNSLPVNNMKGMFSIKINSVKKLVIPDINDDFAKDMGFETLDDLMERIRENIRSSRTDMANNAKIGQILDKLVETHHFELPESAIENELAFLIRETKANEKETRSEEDIRKELLPIAENNVKTAILLELIGIEEGINVTKEDMENELFKTASQFNIAPEELLNYYMKQDGSLLRIHNKAYTRNVFSRLLDYAIIQQSESSDISSDKEVS